MYHYSIKHKTDLELDGYRFKYRFTVVNSLCLILYPFVCVYELKDEFNGMFICLDISN